MRLYETDCANALRAAQDRYEAGQAAVHAAYTAAIAALLKGDDEALPTRREGVKVQPSELLIEAGPDAQQVLLAALRLALSGEKEAAGQLLVQVADALACDYATTHAEVYE